MTLRSGKTLTAKVDQALGRTSANPLPADRLREKFDNCAARALPCENVSQLYAAIQNIENLPDVRALISTMTAGATAGRHSALAVSS